jgi:hypothetical protein
MHGAGEAAHVGADFGHHHFGGAPLNARDRDQTFNRRCERGQQLLDAPAEFRAGFLDIVDVGQQAAYHKAMVRPKATGQGLAQFRDGEHVMLGESSEFRRLRRAIEKAQGDRDRAIRNVCRLYGVNRFDALPGAIRAALLALLDQALATI